MSVAPQPLGSWWSFLDILPAAIVWFAGLRLVYMCAMGIRYPDEGVDGL